MLEARHSDTGHAYAVEAALPIEARRFQREGLVVAIEPKLHGPWFFDDSPSVELLPDVIRGWGPYNAIIKASPRAGSIANRYALALVRRLPCACHPGDLRIERTVKFWTSASGDAARTYVEYEEEEQA